MATIRLNRQAAHSGQLPQVCICCGAPAQQMLPHTFRFEPTWLIILLTLLPKLWMYLSYETFHLRVPVCGSHKNRFKWPSYVGLATAGSLLLLLVPAIALPLTGNADKVIIVILIFLLMVLVYVIARYVLLFSGPRVVEYSAGALQIAGVSEEFVRHVRGGGSFEQAQQYPPQQVYTGNYGLDQAAYKNAYHAPAGSPTKTLLIVSLAVGVPLVIVGMVVIAALGVRSMRPTRRFASFPASPSLRQQASAFNVGDPVYFRLGVWYRGTVLEQRGEIVTVRYVDQFGRESQHPFFPQLLHRELPRGEELAKIRPLPNPGTSPPENIAAKSSTTSASGPTTESSQPAGTSGLPEIPAGLSDGEFQPGDTVYFQLFGKWHEAKVVRKTGPIYELTYFDSDFNEERTTRRPPPSLKRSPPARADVITNSGSPAQSPPDVSRGRGSSQLASKENPPGIAADAENLKKGVKIFAWWGSKWWDGEVVSLRKGEVLVHYDGWGSNWDEWLPPDDIRLKSPQAVP